MAMQIFTSTSMSMSMDAETSRSSASGDSGLSYRPTTLSTSARLSGTVARLYCLFDFFIDSGLTVFS